MLNCLRLSLWISLLLLTACATQTTVHTPEETTNPNVEQNVGTAPTVAPPTTEPSVKVPPRPQPTVSIATDSLSRLARTQYQSGQYQSAIATAERGLRIDRKAAPLYLILAQSYVQLNLPQKAMSFVQQGLRYASPNSDIEIGLLRLKEILQE